MSSTDLKIGLSVYLLYKGLKIIPAITNPAIVNGIHNSLENVEKINFVIRIRTVTLIVS